MNVEYRLIENTNFKGVFDPVETPHIAYSNGTLYYQIKDKIYLVKNDQETRCVSIPEQKGKLVSSIIVTKSGTLYIARKTKIERVNLNDGKVQLLAGSDQTGFEDGVFYDSRFSSLGTMCQDDENIYVVDTSSRIRKLNLVNCTVTTLSPSLTFAFGLDVMSNGDFVVSEWGAISLIKQSLSKTLLAGNNNDMNFKDGIYGEARFNRAAGLVIDGSSVIICDKLNSKLRKLDLTTNKVTTIANVVRPEFIVSTGNSLYVVSQFALHKFVKG